MLHQFEQTATGGARSQANHGGDLLGRKPVASCQGAQNGLVGFVDARDADTCGVNRHTEVRADFFKYGRCEPRFAARRHHALDTTSPLFDQSEFMKHAADDAIAQSGPLSR